MAWSDPAEYWPNLVRPPQNQSPTANMALGAEIRRRAVADLLQQKEYDLKAQRQGLETMEFFNKQELQNKELAGSAELSKVLADPGFKWTDPASVAKIYDVGAKFPSITLKPFWGQLLTMQDRAADNERLKAAELSKATDRTARTDLMASRIEQVAAHNKNQDEISRLRLDLQEAKQETDSILGQRKADILEGKLRMYEQAIEVQKGNLALRTERAKGERERLIQKMPEADRIKLQHELRTLATQLDNFVLTAEEYEKKREEVYGKYAPKESRPGLTIPDSVEFKSVEPITKEAYDKLPAGAEYIAPDGTKRIKK